MRLEGRECLVIELLTKTYLPWGVGQCAWSLIGQLPENTPHHGCPTRSCDVHAMCTLARGAGRGGQARTEGVLGGVGDGWVSGE